MQCTCTLDSNRSIRRLYAWTSESLNVPVSASASFSTAVQEQLAAVPSDPSPAEFVGQRFPADGQVPPEQRRTKSDQSPAYMDKLNADMRLFQAHFAANRPIDRIRSDEIEDFLDSKKAASRRRNNLRSEIITLFRYAQIRLRTASRSKN